MSGNTEEQMEQQNKNTAAEDAALQGELFETVPVLTDEQAAAAIESILFAMGDSVEAERLAQAIGRTTAQTRKLVQSVAASYEEQHRGIRILELNGSYQMCSARECYPSLVRIARIPKKYRLTDVLMETLSIIAYKQPVTKLEIEQIRGVGSDHAVNKLVEFGLAEEVGRLEAPGRPILFGTTEEFLRHFGIGHIEQLPEVDPLQREDFKLEAEQEIDLKLKV